MTMIERVARDVWEKTDGVGSWGKLPRLHQVLLMTSARNHIEAMLEPTEAMVAEMESNIWQAGDDWDCYSGARMWRAGVNKALEE